MVSEVTSQISNCLSKVVDHRFPGRHGIFTINKLVVLCVRYSESMRV